MTPPRKLTPHEAAKISQRIDAARRMAKTTPNTLVFSTIPADADRPCSWCDCPDTPDSPHNRPGGQCGGCPELAEFVFIAHPGPGASTEQRWPICTRHWPEFLAWLARAFDVPLQILSAQVLDEDGPEKGDPR